MAHGRKDTVRSQCTGKLSLLEAPVLGCGNERREVVHLAIRVVRRLGRLQNIFIITQQVDLNLYSGPLLGGIVLLHYLRGYCVTTLNARASERGVG